MHNQTRTIACEHTCDAPNCMHASETVNIPSAITLRIVR